MIPCVSFIRIILCGTLVLCAGCGQSLLFFGKKTPDISRSAAPRETATAPTIPLSASVAPLPAEKQPVCYDTGADYTQRFHGAVLTEDVTLGGKVLVMGVLTIAPQATLRIQPGTILSFAPDPNAQQEGALVIHGRIEAVGSAEASVVFKAATSDRSLDSWRGILALGSEKNNLFEFCRIEGATVGLDSIFSRISLKNTVFHSCRTAARLQGSLFQALGGGVSGSELGYELRDSESFLRDISCSDNGTGVSLSRGSLSVKGSTFAANAATALEAADSKIKISGTSFFRNGTGLIITNCEGSVDNCKIVENREYGIQLLRARMKISANQIYLNAGIGIMADSGGSAAWGNNISRNGIYDFYLAGSEDIRAIGNWWGVPSGRGQKRRIFDKSIDRNSGSVLTFPELASAPPGLL